MKEVSLFPESLSFFYFSPQAHPALIRIVDPAFLGEWSAEEGC
jgi:hypothetical protein